MLAPESAKNALAADFRTRREHAWDYFKVHAGQRLTVFNFYLIISSVLTTALFAVLQRLDEQPLLPAAIGLLLALFSFVFSRLDRRTRHMIKNAEDALRHLERLANESKGGQLAIESVFSRDAAYVQRQRKRVRFFRIFKNHVSYSDCFGYAFLALGCLGLGIAIVAVALYLISA